MRFFAATVALALALTFTGCSNEDNPVSGNDNVYHGYSPLTTGNQWTYSLRSGGTTQQYTINVTGDSTLNGLKYSKTTNSMASGQVGLSRRSGDSIYSFSGSNELLALVEKPIGANWSYTVPAPNNSLNRQEFRVEEIGLKRTVNGKEYSDVMRVHLNTVLIYAGQELQELGSDYYFAKNIGLIEYDAANFGASSKLSSYSIK